MTIRRVIVIFFFCLLFISISAESYDNFVIHPGLTSKAIEIFNNLGEKKLSNQQQNWIIEGSIAEDADPRYLNHFYNPITNKGLNDGLFSGISTKEWAKKQDSASGDYSESAIFSNYKIGYEMRAFQGVGHILHLIQDMSVPAHTRNDAHPEGDPYENWAKKNGSIIDGKYIYVNSMDSVFNVVAKYTNNNFYSKDSFLGDVSVNNQVIEKDLNGYASIYFYHDNYRLYKGVRNKTGYDYILDEKVHQDYWRMLHPKAISYSAGVIDYFMREFERIDEEKEKEKEKLGFWGTFKKYLSFTWSNYEYTFGDSIIASHSVVEDVKKGYKDYGQLVNSGAIKFDKTISDASGKVLGVITAEDLFAPKEAGASDEEGIITPVAGVVVDDEEVETHSNASVLEEGGKGVVGGLVKRVIDGDTIELSTGEKVRYIGVDTPELDGDECLAEEAKLRNIELLKNKKIEIVKDSGVDKDKYGRLLRYVYVDNIFINTILAKEGLAKTFFCEPGWKNCPLTTDDNRKQEILLANIYAKNNSLGIYSEECNKLEVVKEEIKEKFEESKEAVKEGLEIVKDTIVSESGSSSVATPFPIHLFTSSDATPPEISISERPNLTSTSTSADFIFFSEEEGVSYNYRLDGGDWIGCSNILILTNISEGDHVLEVNGSDKYGNVSNPISYEWFIDSIGPVSIFSILDSSYYETGFNLSWSAEDKGSDVDSYDISYSLNSGEWNNYLEVSTSTSTIFTESLSVDDLVEFKVRAYDSFLNVGEWSDIASTTIISSSTNANHIVISEVQLSGATATDEFIELYNPTNSDINLDSYRLTRKTSSGNEYNLVSSLPDIVINSKSYYLITHPSGYTGDITSDYIYSTSQSIATDNTIILYSDPGITEVDKIGFGNVSDFEQNPYFSNPDADESLIRIANASSTIDTMLEGIDEWEGNGYDSDDNNIDFLLSNTPDPGNLESPIEVRVNSPIIPNKISDLSLISASTTDSSLGLRWTITGNNNIEDGALYDLRYKEKSGECDLNIDWNNASRVNSPSLPTPSGSSGETHEVVVDNLSVSTEYCFSFKVFNGENWSVLSNQISGSTNSGDILVDSISNSYSGWGNNLNWSHTVSGSDRILVVPVSWKWDNYYINSIKYGSEELTLAVEEEGNHSGLRTSIYYLVNPPIGTDTINIDFNMHTYCGASAISLNNVDISDPIMLATSRVFQDFRINTSVDLSSNGMIIDSFSLKSTEDNANASNNQTEFFNQELGNITYPIWAGASYRNVNSAGTYEMAWDIGIDSRLLWSHAIIVVNPL